MKSAYIIISAMFFAISALAQKDTTEPVEQYDYDTTLTGGYSINFKIDDSLQYLFLKQGQKTIAELSSTSRGLPYKNLGYLGADFQDCFVLVHSFGSGNPDYIELIQKGNGKNMLKRGASWIDVDKNNGFLLYCDKGAPTEKDKMTLLNIKTKQKQFFYFPKDIFNEAEVLDRIEIREITINTLVIKYNTEGVTKLKKYPR